VHLALVAEDSGDHTRAEELLQESLSIGRETGNQVQIALSLNHLGAVACATGDYEKAERYFREALRTAADTRADRTILQVLAGMAALPANTGEELRAIELLAFAVSHPSIDRVTKDKADRLLTELTSGLSRRQVEGAKRRARAMALDGVVRELLGSDLAEGGPDGSSAVAGD
jgi:tetratricopeptide (TPR) repeat protein